MKKITVLFVAMSLQACSIALTPEGQAIRLVDSQTDYNCKFVGVVNARNNNGATGSHSAENAMNKARNSVADQGGNALRIIDVDHGGKAITGEALLCKFDS